MRPSDFILDPDRLDDIIGYILTVLLSLWMLAICSFIKSRKKIALVYKRIV
jgi:hypothetical protein